MKKLPVITFLAVCLLAAQAWADAITIDPEAGFLCDQHGNTMGLYNIALWVVDTGTNGLAGLENLSPTSSLAEGTYLTTRGGATNEYLILSNTDCTNSGYPGFNIPAITDVNVYPDSPVVMNGQEVFCLWFPSLTSSATEVGAETWYGAYRDPATTPSATLDYPYQSDNWTWTIPPAGYTVSFSAVSIDAGAELGLGYQIGGTPDSDLRAAYQTPLPGDANGDGTVDINDLTIVLAHYGQTGMAWAQGEFTGDGTVDINDLTIVLAHYGQSIGASAAATAAVPEPSCLVLVGIGVAALLASARRRRN
jgi:hypothetical protein